MGTKELLCFNTIVPMSNPLVTISSRNMSYKFALGEAWWILSGDDRVETIEPFNKNIAQFSDNGKTFFGAYGTKIVPQLPYVVDKLISDISSRQALLTIWRESPPASKDIPCTICLQFIIREDTLNVIATMRSSDAWLGWVYDVFNFSMCGALVAIYLKNTYKNLTLGNLYLTAGSQHLYERNMEKACKIMNGKIDHDFEYRPIDFRDFNPVSFLHHLNKLTTCRDVNELQHEWLKELVIWRSSK